MERVVLGGSVKKSVKPTGTVVDGEKERSVGEWLTTDVLMSWGWNRAQGCEIGVGEGYEMGI